VFVFWGVWEAFIYPKWGSPLRNIPTVTVRNLHSNVYHCIDSEKSSLASFPSSDTQL
jgi:hypothetical protein